MSTGWWLLQNANKQAHSVRRAPLERGRWRARSGAHWPLSCGCHKQLAAQCNVQEGAGTAGRACRHQLRLPTAPSSRRPNSAAMACSQSDLALQQDRHPSHAPGCELPGAGGPGRRAQRLCSAQQGVHVFYSANWAGWDLPQPLLCWLSQEGDRSRWSFAALQPPLPFSGSRKPCHLPSLAAGSAAAATSLRGAGGEGSRRHWRRCQRNSCWHARRPHHQKLAAHCQQHHRGTSVCGLSGLGGSMRRRKGS